MLKSFTYHEPRKFDDDLSTNGDAMMRAIEFQMRCLLPPYTEEHRTGVESNNEEHESFADSMYNYIASLSIEELTVLLGDLESLVKSCKKTSEAVAQMVVGKIMFNNKVPSAAEARKQNTERQAKGKKESA